MSKKLSLDELTVESFSTAGFGDVSVDAVKPSKNYSECPTCGIACTYNCPVPTANYTDCGSCGIACTPVEPC